MLNNVKNAEMNGTELMNVTGGGWLADSWRDAREKWAAGWQVTCELSRQNMDTIIRCGAVAAGAVLTASGLGPVAGTVLTVAGAAQAKTRVVSAGV